MDTSTLSRMVYSSTVFLQKCKNFFDLTVKSIENTEKLYKEKSFDKQIEFYDGLRDELTSKKQEIKDQKIEVEDISKTIQENMTKSVEFLHDAEGKFESIIKEIDKIKKSDTLAKIALRKLIATGWKPEDGTVEQ